jgi:DNA-binding MarR family transcriptional regulator
MSHRATAWAFKQPARSPVHKLVLILLADWAGETGLAWPKQATIAKYAECSIRTINRTLADLEADGLFIRKPDRRRDGRRASDRFQLDIGGGF